MANDIPLFPVTTVGSWPRSPNLLRAQRRRQHGDISAEEFNLQPTRSHQR
jgi:5-methyltetrahydropteroyltriglutamate--homocysteine methyltransferase